MMKIRVKSSTEEIQAGGMAKARNVERSWMESNTLEHKEEAQKIISK
jgi:hypothetical protein